MLYVCIYILAALCGMRDLHSLTRDSTLCPLQWKCGVLTTRPPGKSFFFFFFTIAKTCRRETPCQAHLTNKWQSWNSKSGLTRSSHGSPAWGSLPKHHFEIGLKVFFLSSFNICLHVIITARIFQMLCCAQSCPALWDPVDCNPPGSSVYGIS